MIRRQDEFKLSCVVADFLQDALPRTACWSHFPAGEARSKITGARLKRMGLAKGWPDYLVVHDGKLVGLELKAGNGKASPEQCAVGDAFVANGFTWQIVRSLEEVERVLVGAGIPLKASVQRLPL